MLVQTSGKSNLWHCPPVNNANEGWWCGNSGETTPCQPGIHASFVPYTTGYILGFPPLITPTSALTKDPSNLVITGSSVGPSSKTSTISTSSPMDTSTGPFVPTRTQEQSTRLPTDPPIPAQTQAHSTSLPTAIGVGIGVPLGIATIGLLAFLFWKESVRQRRSKPRITSQEIGLNGGHFVAATFGSRTELPDTQLPREVCGRGRTELPSI